MISFKKIQSVFLVILMMITIVIPGEYVFGDDDNIEPFEEGLEDSDESTETVNSDVSETAEDLIIPEESEDIESQDVYSEASELEDVTEDEDQGTDDLLELTEPDEESEDQENPADSGESDNEQDGESDDALGKLVSATKDYSITVSFDGNAKIPEGAQLAVTEIKSKDEKYNQYLEKAASKVLSDAPEDVSGDTLPYARFFDIKILDGDGSVIEPAAPVSVNIDLKDGAPGTEDVNFAAVHFSDDDNAGVEQDIEDLDVEVIDITSGEATGTVELEADSFSVYGVVYYYTVDFYYTPEDGEEGVAPAEYHMNGGSEMMLSDLFTELGITRNTGDIASVEFTDTSLVTFTKSGNDYTLKSLKPFTTSETLTITFTDGQVIVIGVEDAVTQYGAIPNSNGKAYYEFDSATGELRIRALNAATETAYVNGNFTTKGAWPWDNIRSQVKKISFTTGASGFGVGFASVANFAFADMTNLTEVDFSGMGEIRANGIARMFSGCTSLTTIDMSSVTTNGNLSNMQNMFNGCTSLKTVTLNNPEFKTRNEADKTGAQLTGMFGGCTSLEEVNMSNITLTGNHVDLRELDNPFTGSSVKKIIMDNVKFENVKTTERFIRMLDNLEEVYMRGNIDARSVEYMTEMFQHNPALKTLDVSGFGKLDSIINMEDFVGSDTALETLIIDGMDNSHIGPKNNRHSLYQTDPNNPRYIPDGDETKIGATEFGRDFGLKTCTSLKTLSAKDAKVWMVSNDRGVPGSEYYSAASDKDIFWWWMTTEEPGDNGKQLKFEADGGKGTYTLNKRDYVDLITDRDGSAENTHTINPPQDALPDKDKNINIQNDLNPNGAGFLAPGVYTVLDSTWETKQVSFPDSYYRISYIGEVPFEVRVNGQEVTLNDGESTTVGNENNLVVARSPNSNNIYINTTTMTWPTSGTKTLNDIIEVVYKDAAIDINGKKHDVVITITEIKFKDLDKVPTNPNRGSHNQNKYYDTDGGGQYYRTIMQARSDGTIFRDLLRISDPATPWIETSALSGGAGTDIKFNVKIDKANPDTSFVFYVDDLDVAYSQNWQYPVPSDPCYDTLTPPNSTYGIGGEGFELRDGNDLSTVTFADHTGLFLADNNTVLSTGSDPSTSWSEFAVKAKADGNGSSYTWTSGIGCSTYVLRNTPKMDTGSIKIQPQVTKTLQGGALQADQFEFTLTEESVDPNDAPKPSNGSQTKKNDAAGTVTFETLEFKANGTNALIYDSANTAYYPGTSPSNNARGNGQHNTFTYVYKVKEVAGTDPEITYNVGSKEYELKIVITTPENDAEMAKGIKAEVYVDGTLKNTFWSKEGADVKTFNIGDFINEITEVTLIKSWDDSSNSKNFRPADLEGYVTYDKDGTEVRLTTSAYQTTHTGAAWAKEGNTWKFTFRLPSGAAFTGGGETAVPKGYTHDQSQDKLDTAAGTLTMTNKLKNTEETATLKRTIEYKYEDDNSPVLDENGKAIVIEQSLTFKREVTGWDDNGDPIWGAWTPDAGTLPQANSPKADRSGYTPKQTSIAAVGNLSQADANDTAKAEKYPDVTVLYEKPPTAGEKKTYGGIGETQKGTPPFTKGSSSFVDFSLIDPKTGDPVDSLTVDGEGTYTVDKTTGEVTFVPVSWFTGTATTVTVRGTDGNGNTADGKYTPTLVDNVQEVEKTQTISYLYEDGTPVLDENGNPIINTRSAKFSRTGTVDPETGTITWDPWTPKELDTVLSPIVDDYSPDKIAIEETTATPDNWPEDEDVIYSFVPIEEQEVITITRTIVYRDKDGNEMAPPVTQRVALTRIKTTDKDGNSTYTDWQIVEEASEYGAVKSPEIDGYLYDTPQVPPWDIDLDNPESVVEATVVTYYPDETPQPEPGPGPTPDPDDPTPRPTPNPDPTPTPSPTPQVRPASQTSVKSGDETDIGIWFVLLIASLALVIALRMRQKLY